MHVDRMDVDMGAAPDDGPRSGDQAFERALVEELPRRFRAGELSPPPLGDVAPLLPGDLLRLPRAGSAEHAAALRFGEDALRAGRVAVAVVAGGAATRFGGGVKALVPVLGDGSFLDLKLADCRRAGDRHGAPVPVAVMTSSVTHDRIRAHLADVGARAVLFTQRMLPRLTPAGEVFLDRGGRPSLAPAGHGDFLRIVRA